MPRLPTSPLRALFSKVSPLAGHTMALAGFVLLSVSACNPGDVGAPCNHGRIEPPDSKLVTFPALSCNDLLCIYADEEEPSPDPCSNDADCNAAATGEQKFECANGSCQLRIDYVLERSMCSRRCNDDSDCRDGGITDRVVVDDTECREGFACARIQSLGEFCCQKLCVCRDDLGVTTQLDADCDMGTATGCCDVADGVARPEGCGP